MQGYGSWKRSYSTRYVEIEKDSITCQYSLVRFGFFPLLFSRNRFSLMKNVHFGNRIDPDALSRLLPERPQYLSHSPATASSLLHPEASLLQEICAEVAKKRKRSLVIDGSLTDCKWFEGFMKGFKEEGYECEILFVVSVFFLSLSFGSSFQTKGNLARF